MTLTTVLIRLLLFFAVLFLLDTYVFKGIAAAMSQFQPRIRSVVKLVYWTANVAFMVFAAWVFIDFPKVAGPTSPQIKVLFMLFVLLYIPKLVFGLFLLGEDAWRLLRAGWVGVSKLSGNGEALDFFESRRRFVSQVGVFAASIPFLGILYGVTRGKYNYKVHRAEIAFKDLPKEFDGLTITQLSDVHSGSFDNRREVEAAVALANEQGSDIMFFTGDLVNNRADEMVPWVDVFRELKAPMGIYSVLGNHDYGDYSPWPSAEAKQANLEHLFDIHEQVGFKLLKNEHLKIERNGATIDLLGIENWGAGGFTKYGDLEKTLSGTNGDSFKILLSHDPSHWEHQVMEHDTHIHLTLSGHTHGMQFGFEIPGIRFSPVQFRYPRWAGLYKENDRYLYVNRGFGFLGFPGRVGIWPEITVITLRTA